jgi:hypothetical protein
MRYAMLLQPATGPVCLLYGETEVLVMYAGDGHGPMYYTIMTQHVKWVGTAWTWL